MSAPGATALRIAGLAWLALYALGLLGYIAALYFSAGGYAAFRERLGEVFDTSNITLYVVLFVLFLPGILLFQLGGRAPGGRA